MHDVKIDRVPCGYRIRSVRDISPKSVGFDSATLAWFRRPITESTHALW